MRKILLLAVLVIFLTGCGITGKVVQEIEQQPTQDEKEQAMLDEAISEKDVTKCYTMQTQHIREACFMKLAQELKDPSICMNLLGKSLRDTCKAGI